MANPFRFRRGRPADEAALAATLDATTAATRRPFLRRLDGPLRRGELTDEFWEALEETLLAADLGVGTTASLVGRVRERAESERVGDAAAVRSLLQEEMAALLRRPVGRGQLWGVDEEPPSPHVILIVGVNGTGKTTTMAKLASAYQEQGRSVILGAADTFRAAAIDQVQYWGERLGLPVVAHQAGADPGAVAYDTVSALVSRGADVALIDTAGRLETKKSLMAELGKIRRVVAGRQAGAPHEVLLVLDATTGQNGLAQARVFCEATEVTSICLAKLDSASKGGVVFAVAEELGVPVRFVGTGVNPADLAPFDPDTFVAALFGEGGS